MALLLSSTCTLDTVREPAPPRLCLPLLPPRRSCFLGSLVLAPPYPCGQRTLAGCCVARPGRRGAPGDATQQSVHASAGAFPSQSLTCLNSGVRTPRVLPRGVLTGLDRGSPKRVVPVHVRPNAMQEQFFHHRPARVEFSDRECGQRGRGTRRRRPEEEGGPPGPSSQVGEKSRKGN